MSFLGLAKDALGRLVARFKDGDVRLVEDPTVVVSGVITSQASPVLNTVYDITSLASQPLEGGLYVIEVRALIQLTWTSGAPAGSAGSPSLTIRDQSGGVLEQFEGPAVGDDTANYYAPRALHQMMTATYIGRLAAGSSVKGSMSVRALSGTPVFSNISARGDLLQGSRLTIRRLSP